MTFDGEYFGPADTKVRGIADENRLQSCRVKRVGV